MSKAMMVTLTDSEQALVRRAARNDGYPDSDNGVRNWILAQAEKALAPREPHDEFLNLSSIN